MRFAPQAAAPSKKVQTVAFPASDPSFEPFAVSKTSSKESLLDHKLVASADLSTISPEEETLLPSRSLESVLHQPTAVSLKETKGQKIVLKRVACFNHVPIDLGLVGNSSSAQIFDTPALADPMRVRNPFSESRSSNFSHFMSMIGKSAISPKPLDDQTHRARVYQYLKVSRQMEEANSAQTSQEPLPVLEVTEQKETVLDQTEEMIVNQEIASVAVEISEELPALNFPRIEVVQEKAEKVEAIFNPKLQLISSQKELSENLDRLYKIADSSELLPLLQASLEICQRIKIILAESSLFSSNTSETERSTIASFQGEDWSTSSKFNHVCYQEIDQLLMTIDQILREQNFTATALHLVRKKMKIAQNLLAANISADFSMMRYLLHIREHGTAKVNCADWRTTYKISTVSNLSFYSLKKDELKLQLTSKKSLAFLLFAHAKMNFELRKIMNALLTQEIHRCRIVSKTAITFESLCIQEKQKKNLFFRLVPSAAYILPWATDLASRLFLKVATGKKISEEKVDFALARLQRLQLT